MSSRKGNVVLFSQLHQALDQRIEEVYMEKLRAANPEYWTDAACADARHKIALASMRYGMLNQDMGSQIVFDLEAWAHPAGNSGPYLLYAYARTNSILAKLKEHLGEEGQAEQLQRVIA